MTRSCLLFPLLSIQGGNRLLRKVRTYRSVYRLLAVSLVLSSVLTIVGHVCMMDEAHAGPMIEACCCEKGHAAAHEGMHEMPAKTCDEKPEKPAQHEHAHGDCCATNVQNVADVATRAYQSFPDKRFIVGSISLLAQRSIETPSLKRAQTLQDTGPPPAPPLHILYASFLI